MRPTLVVLSLAAAIVATAAIEPSRAANDRVFYEITVTAPGTRSQGWRGVLYDRNGVALVRAPGETIATNAGVFVNVSCDQPWKPCGFIEVDMQRWMQANGGGNAILDNKRWVYRLYVVAQCTRSEGWRGLLQHGGRAVARGGGRVDTPMGPFVWKTGSHMWDSRGWFHEAWPASSNAPGHWPCG